MEGRRRKEKMTVKRWGGRGQKGEEVGEAGRWKWRDQERAVRERARKDLNADSKGK